MRSFRLSLIFTAISSLVIGGVTLTPRASALTVVANAENLSAATNRQVESW